jgi:hypothetical protein
LGLRSPPLGGCRSSSKARSPIGGLWGPGSFVSTQAVAERHSACPDHRSTDVVANLLALVGHFRLRLLNAQPLSAGHGLNCVPGLRPSPSSCSRGLGLLGGSRAAQDAESCIELCTSSFAFPFLGTQSERARQDAWPPWIQNIPCAIAWPRPRSPICDLLHKRETWHPLPGDAREPQRIGRGLGMQSRCVTLGAAVPSISVVVDHGEPLTQPALTGVRVCGPNPRLRWARFTRLGSPLLYCHRCVSSDPEAPASQELV